MLVTPGVVPRTVPKNQQLKFYNGIIIRNKTRSGITIGNISNDVNGRNNWYKSNGIKGSNGCKDSNFGSCVEIILTL